MHGHLKSKITSKRKMGKNNFQSISPYLWNLNAYINK